MRLTPLAYGTLIATTLFTGVAVFYNPTPPRTIRAVDVAEIVEGTLERTAALGGWAFTGSTNGEAGWGYYVATNDANATNYSFSFYPENPVVGSVASRDLIVRTLQQIQSIATNYVQSYTATSVVYWTSTGLWDQCSVADGTYPNWTVAVTSGAPVYGHATNLSYSAQTAVLYEAYRLLAAMTSTTFTASFSKTNAFYGSVPDDINWAATDSIGPVTNDTLPTELYWIHQLNINAEVLGELYIGINDATNYLPSDGSPAQRNNDLDHRAAYYLAYVNPYMSAYADKAPAYSPYTWTATGTGDFPCVRWAQKSAGYITAQIADLAAGVTAVVSVSIMQTGITTVLTGSDYSSMAYTTNNVITNTVFVWTNSCSGTITGMVQAVSPPIAPTLWSFFDGSELPAVVQTFVPDPIYGTGGDIQEYGIYPGANQTAIEADTWFEFRRPTIVEWTFRYCKP